MLMIDKKNSQDAFGSLGTWHLTDEAKEWRTKLNMKKAEERLVKRQCELMQRGGGGKAQVNSFIELFTTSPLGLGRIKAGRGKRSGKDQTRFRKALEKASDSKHPTDPGLQWCPITEMWANKDTLTAAHLFAHRHGQAAMDNIFGEQDEPELFSPRNGILMLTIAEKRMDKGLFVIVPNVPDDHSQDDVSNWHQTAVKEYKIRVLEPEDPLMQEHIVEGRCWNELDGKRVNFRNDFRPRARYLYFVYCTVMLQRAWSETEDWRKSGNILTNELGKPWWATRGRYMKQNMIRAFVREIGHESESLFMGAADKDKSTQVDQTAFTAALIQVQAGLSLRGGSGDCSDDECWDSDGECWDSDGECLDSDDQYYVLDNSDSDDSQEESESSDEDRVWDKDHEKEDDDEEDDEDGGDNGEEKEDGDESDEWVSTSESGEGEQEDRASQ